MKTTITILITLLGLCAQAANPSFQQFNTNDFIVVDRVSVRVNTNKFVVTNSFGFTNGYVRNLNGFATNLMVRDLSGIESIDSGLRLLRDATPATAMNWNERILFGSTNELKLDWQSNIFYGAWNLGTNSTAHNPQLSGTVSGTPTFSGAITASQSGNTLGGTFTGNIGANTVTFGDISPNAFSGTRTLGYASGKMFFGIKANEATFTNITVLGTGGITNAGPLVMNQITVSNVLPPADSIKLFAFDVGGTAEMFVMDEAGNLTQLSPHAMTSPGIASDTNALPVILHHRNVYSGEQEWIHISKLARAVEKLTGEQFIYSQPIPVAERRNWQQDQNEHQAAYNAERVRLLAEYNTPIVEILEPMGITNIISSVNTNIVVPPVRDVRQPEPPIINRRSRP